MVFALNPVAFLVDAYRQILMVGVAPDALHLVILGLASAAASYLLLLVLRRHSRYLALRAITR